MDIPGEYLVPKAMPYYVRIARFMPRVEIVQRHHSTVRRLYIQGDNGKVRCTCIYTCTYMYRCMTLPLNSDDENDHDYIYIILLSPSCVLCRCIPTW